MAQQLSKASLVVRVLLIVVLVVLVGAFVMERRAAGAAQSAFARAKEVVAAKKNSADLIQLLGRKPDYDKTQGMLRELSFNYKGVIRDYSVDVRFNVLDSGEVGEEAELHVWNKIKGQREESGDAEK